MPNARHRWVSRLLRTGAIVLVAGALAVAPALGSPSTASAAVGGSVTTASPDAAVTRFGGCIAGGGTGDLLMLLDDSGSLRQSDPDDDRVQAAQYLVRQLGRFADQSGADIDVRLARFSTTYEHVGGWTTLNGGSASAVSRTLAGLGAADDGYETDYWTALNGARGDLAERASSRSGPSCQAIAWFTDGKAEYVVRDSRSEQDRYGTSKPFAPDADLTSRAGVQGATVAAQRDLCRTGGLADQLRSSGVTTFAIGLESANAPAEDFAPLEAIATGTSSAPKSSCGSVTTPVPGSFTLASDIDNLLFAFDALSTPGRSPLSQESGICQVRYCTDQAHDFVLDTSTPDVHVLAAADVSAVDVDVVGPTGDPVPLPRSAVGKESTVTVAGGTATYTWESESAVSIDLVRAKDGTPWAGLWKIVFIDPAGSSAGKKSRTNIHISSDLVPTWSDTESPRLHLGSRWPGTFGVGNGGGAGVAPSSIQGTAVLTATVTDAGGHSSTIVDEVQKDQITDQVSAEVADLDIGAGTLEMRLDLTTAPVRAGGVVVHEGTPLAPAIVRVPVSILAPVRFPVVTDSVDFGTLDGTTSATASLPVSGAGCAWVEGQPSIIAGPSDTGDVTVTSKDHDKASDCLRATREGGSLEVTLSFDRSQNGSVNGTFPVRIASADDSGRPLTTKVAFTADLRRPLNEANFLVALLVALIAGPGIPLGLLYLASFLVARIPTGALLSQRTRVDVIDGVVIRDGAPFAFRSTDFTVLQTVSGRNARSLVVSGLTLRARPSRSPFGAGHVVATQSGVAAASDVPPAFERRGGTVRARLPLAIQGHWVVLAPVGSPDGSAEVVVFLAANAPEAARDAIADSIRDRLPEVLEQLHLLEGRATTSDDAFVRVGEEGSGAQLGGFGLDEPAGGRRPVDRSADARPSAPPSSASRGDDTGFGFGFEDGADR